MSAIDPLSVGRMMNTSLDTAQKNQIATQDFEAYLVEMLCKEMRKTIPEGIFSSPAMETFTEMMDKALAQEIAESGGLGLASSMLSKMNHFSSDDATKSLSEMQTGHLRENDPSLREIAESSTGNSLLDNFHSFSTKLKELVGHRPVSGKISSHFGLRHHPIHGDLRKHDGIDIAAAKGSSIEAVMDGTVIFAGKRGGYGNTLVIEHADGYQSLYAHCDQLNVKKGDVITSGQNIGTVGDTGVTTGPHLHFEMRAEGKTIDPLQVFSWSFSE